MCKYSTRKRILGKYTALEALQIVFFPSNFYARYKKYQDFVPSYFVEATRYKCYLMRRFWPCTNKSIQQNFSENTKKKNAVNVHLCINISPILKYKIELTELLFNGNPYHIL